jgi:hypothetical protein
MRFPMPTNAHEKSLGERGRSARQILASLALSASLLLAGCNASPQPTQGLFTPIEFSAYKSALDFDLPKNAICTIEIKRYAKIAYTDQRIGVLTPWVFEEIRADIFNAAEACRVGRDALARAIVVASERKHGYPSPL